MMSSKDRIGQIIKAFITVVTLITLTSRFCIIKAAFDHMLRLTRGTCDAIGPAQLTNGLITLHVIDEMLDVNLHDWTPVRDRKMGWRQYTPSSNATTLESNKSVEFLFGGMGVGGHTLALRIGEGVGLQTCQGQVAVVFAQDRGDGSYTLLNAPTDTPQACLIAWSCRRYFTERTFEDAKTEIGWDEFQAQKYRAWEHHLALTAAALWFVAQTKFEWVQMYARDPELVHQLQVEVLPALSTANVRELLKAVLPLPQLTPTEAMDLVITHLINRARSTSSRLKSQVKPPDSS